MKILKKNKRKKQNYFLLYLIRKKSIYVNKNNIKS